MDAEFDEPVDARAGGSAGDAADFLDSQAMPAERRVFVNRTLRLDHIDEVGFDMDYTLLPYRKRNIETLSYELTLQKLIENRGYPESLRDLVYDPDFVVRGLVVDKKLGNILKMDCFNHVGRVYHGRRSVDKDVRRKIYRAAKIRVTSSRYHWIDTLFALPEAALYADIIDLFELKLGRKRIDYNRLFQDIRDAIDECHRDDSLKSKLRSDFSRYIMDDPDIPHALHKLRSAGKKLFLLTNSYWLYTNAAMSHLLNGRLPEYANWQNYFDLIVVGASKPGFFTEDRPFLEVDQKTGETRKMSTETLKKDKIYQGGCFSKMEASLSGSGDRVLYIGDHIYGDIIRSKKNSMWRAALVLEELEEEVRLRATSADMQTELEDIEQKRSGLDHDITQVRLRISAIEQAAALDGADLQELQKLKRQLKSSLDRKRKALRKLIQRRDQLDQAFEKAFNPYWGSVFKEGPENSLFGRQVEAYACIYTSRVSNLRFYSPHRYFRAPRHWMSHEKLRR